MISSTVSFSAINTELGNSSTATVSLNDANPRWLSGVPSGTISASNFVGSSRDPGTLTATYYQYSGASTQFVNSKLYIFNPGSYQVGAYPSVLYSSTPSVTTSYTPTYLSNASGILQSTLNGTTIVGVNAGGLAYKSTDGVNWSSSTIVGGGQGTYCVTWASGASKYIAGGSSKGIYTSSDAVSWTQQTAPSGIVSYASFYTAVSSGSVYILAGGNNSIVRSTNTTTWTQQTSPASASAIFKGGVWTGAIFVLVAEDGKIITSPDGITWTLRFTGSQALYAVAWNGSLLVAVGAAGTILTSPDAITWTTRTNPFQSNVVACNSVVWSGSQWFIVGDNCILNSSNGTTWTLISNKVPWRYGYFPLAANNLSQVSFVAWDHTVTSFYSSSDGLTWTQRTPDANFYCNTIEYFNSIWIAIGYHSSYGAGVYTSSDGITWTLRATPAGTSTLKSIAFSGSRYVAVGESGTVISSADAITWTNHSTENYEIWCGVAWNGTKFFVVDDNSWFYGFETKTLSSSNGTTWTASVVPNVGPMTSMVSNNSEFIINSTGEYEGVTMYRSLNALTIQPDPASNSQTVGGFNVYLQWDGYDIWANNQNMPALYRREKDGSAWVQLNSNSQKITARAPTVVVTNSGGIFVWNGSTITTRV